MRTLSLLVGFLVGMTGPLASGSEVTVATLSPTREVSSRAVTSVAFRVTNTGGTADTYDLVLELPPGLSVVAMASSVEIAPGESRVVPASVFVSSLALAGEYTLTFRATSATIPAHTGSSAARFVILPWAAVELRLPTGGQTWPGGTATYSVWVINRGNAVDTFRIAPEVAWGTAQAIPAVVHLLPGEGAEVLVKVSIPEGTKIGDKTYLTVIARSTADPSVYDSGGLWTTVTTPPLGPGAAALSLYPTVGATVGWTGRLEGGDFTSLTSLSLGGPLGDGRYVALSGTLGVQATGVWLERGWIEYRKEDWSVRLGSIEFSSGAVDLTVLGLRYTYHPPGWPLRTSLYYSFADSRVALESRIGAADRALELRVEGGGDFSISTQFVSEVSSVRLQVGSISGITVSTYGCVALSGGISWGEEFRIALSGSAAPFSGRLAYNLRGTLARVLGALGYTVNLDPLALRLALESEWKADSDPLSPLETLSLNTRLEASGRRRSGMVSWSGGLRFDTTSDLLYGGVSLTSSASGGLAVSPGGGFSLGVEARVTLSGSSATTDLALRLAGFLFEASRLELKWVLLGQEEFSISLRGPGASVKFLTKPGVLELSVGFSFRTLLPLFATLGRVEGVAFVDADGNGVRDPTEEVVPGLALQLGGDQAVTDSTGTFRFPAMVPGTYELRALAGMLGYCPKPALPLRLELAAGEVKTIALALVPAARLSGQVVTVSRSAATGEWVPDRPVVRARVVATQGETSYTTFTDSQGGFLFVGLCPGTWEVRVELPELAPPHALAEEALTVDLGPGGAVEVEFRAIPVPRPIRPPLE